ncbi:glutamine amidotransferase-related protein [Zobellella iuensis]|uniref:Glutamine amidotransferase n=1 Tax=Zobellella iuensis TaxID=2803811 RepID=A0ABS1QMH0_9GAMM|nr:glutamine amidotransferase [Zobellella iuensis]MBL1375802.1 glutamine amidotransferase [Zobellella iuensis]
MKIGILQCDDVLEQLQPRHGNYPEMIRRLLLAVDNDLEFVVYRVLDQQLPEHPAACDAYITTGSRHGVNDGHDWVNRLADFVALLYREQRKLVGICFGHQLMAKALGGEVVQSDKGWGIGVSFNQVDKTQPWMTPPSRALDLVVSHQDQVSRLPADAEVLAGSPFCPFYMVQYRDHFLGIQGHPEFSRPYSADLMATRQERFPPHRYREALASLGAEVDDLLLARWILAFMRS